MACLGSRWTLTFGVGEPDGKGAGLWLTLTDIGGNVPDPTAIAADVGRQFHVRGH